METKAVAIPNWNDLVFDGRNKTYGAYVLRKLYLRRLVLGLGASVAMMAVLILMPQLFPAVKIVKPPLIEIKIKGLQPPPILERKPPQPRPAQQRQARRTDLPPLVVTVPVETLPVVDEPAHVDIPDNGQATMIVDQVEPVAPVIETPQVWTNAEVMPSYEGGVAGMMKYLGKKLRYPPSAQRIGAEGTVFVSFIVNGDGTVSDVVLVRGFNPDCDREAMRVIAAMPGWTGGKQHGNPVRVRMVLPIKFSLNT